MKANSLQRCNRAELELIIELYNKTCQEFRDTVVDTPELREKYKEIKEYFENLDGSYDCPFEDFLEQEKKSAEIINDSVYHHLTFEKLLQK